MAGSRKVNPWKHAVRWSPEPPSFYADRISDYILADTLMWNWRWVGTGDKENRGVDESIKRFFSDELREYVCLAPLDALEAFEADGIFQGRTEEPYKRLRDAHARLFPERVAKREGNVITVNFGRFIRC